MEVRAAKAGKKDAKKAGSGGEFALKRNVRKNKGRKR
jgi:hypothetical protein